MTSKLHIAIVGSGVAGSALASTLLKYANQDAFEIDVYEAAAEIDDVGAGVTIYGRSFDIIAALGEELKDELERVGDISQSLIFDFMRMDGKEGSGKVVSSRALGAGCSFHRADFRRAFLTKSLQTAPNLRMHFSKRLASFTRDTTKTEFPISMTFRDGTTAVADVLLGCDGVRSPIRHGMLDIAATELEQPELRKLGPAWFSGWVTHRSIIPMEDLDAEWARMAPDAGPHRLHTESCLYSGKNAHIISYALRHEKEVNIGVFALEPSAMGKAELPLERWVKHCGPEPVLELLEGWEPEVLAMARPVKEYQKWYIHVSGPLPTYVHDQIALLGDAAHSMTPHNGAGANQALEDAYLLGRVLASPLVTRDTIPLALKAYDTVRRPRGNAAHSKSFDTGSLCNLTTPDGRDDMDAVAAMLKDNTRLWFVLGKVEDDVQEALSILSASVKAAEASGASRDGAGTPTVAKTVLEASVVPGLVA
ncbi:FAD/NAD(P)-binding domain-containing protein [Exidia glandulosa HHB12029]|uniref:FAD/NAD(P)-binding domain-containing protein n=1 Tax=Exidia glandulosa HHB12029 TaxID=1314781 RepID=A0A165HBP1_EXIGL|nr:FAD/NAD(P)-binding domain-containing protein [Exidia glandulosa HHB12029]